MNRTLLTSGLVMSCLAVGLACSSGGAESNPVQSKVANENQGTAGQGSDTQADEIDISGGLAAAGTAAVLTDEQACLETVSEAKRVDVDLYLMLDRSESMLNLASDGVTKWDAVHQALNDFLASPDSEDIGIGLKAFPQKQLGAPDQCLDARDCGLLFGPCLLPGICLTTDELCSSDAGCTGPDNLCLLGSCSLDPIYACALGGQCGDGGGDCIPVPGLCRNMDSCEAGDYATPEVPISLGVTRNPSLTQALAQLLPGGFTPTRPALEGALAYASSWGSAHPDRVAAVVLATDGLPSECYAAGSDPIVEVLNTASAAYALPQPIRTYVIGVFSPEEEAAFQASQNLDALAFAGGTEAAFVVNTDQDVATEFAAALKAITATAIACEFAVPVDAKLDYDRVNLRFSDATGATTQLVNVADKAGCADADATGWYYVVDPETEKPHQISVCPGVCAAFNSALKSDSAGAAARVDLQIGCKTIVR